MPIRKVEHIDDHLVVEHKFKGQQRGTYSLPYHAVHSLEEVPAEVVKGHVVSVPTLQKDVLLVPKRDDDGTWGFDAYRQTKCAGS